jgi:hypothetical protein
MDRWLEAQALTTFDYVREMEAFLGCRVEQRWGKSTRSARWRELKELAITDGRILGKIFRVDVSQI